jgi:hypothetical protein
VATYQLPTSLPERDGAGQLAQELEPAELRGAAQAIVDLVFTDDTVLLDSLPAGLEASLVPVLGVLAAVLDEGGTDTELVVAARLVRHCVERHLGDAPGSLAAAAAELPA